MYGATIKFIEVITPSLNKPSVETRTPVFLLDLFNPCYSHVVLVSAFIITWKKNKENPLGVNEEKKVMPSSSLIERCVSSKLR